MWLQFLLVKYDALHGGMI